MGRQWILIVKAYNTFCWLRSCHIGHYRHCFLIGCRLVLVVLLCPVAVLLAFRLAVLSVAVRLSSCGSVSILG